MIFTLCYSYLIDNYFKFSYYMSIDTIFLEDFFYHKMCLYDLQKSNYTTSLRPVWEIYYSILIWRIRLQ